MMTATITLRAAAEVAISQATPPRYGWSVVRLTRGTDG